MIKKILLLSLVASQLTISCSSEDSPETNPTTEQTLAEQIAEIVKQPYSKLTPDQQKTKLEVEANDMLVQLDKSKSSSAIEAMENLNRLLDINSVDIFNGKNDNQVEDIINVAGVYGIYTWNNADQKWDKTSSSTDLKFVFPAKESQTANNATFSSKGIASDKKVEIEDSYDWESDVTTNDFIFLPTSADATLTIDNNSVATFTQTAKYSSKNDSPDEFAYKMTLNDGYTWEMSGKKGTETTGKATLTYNGKTLLDFNSGSSANIDALIDNDELVQYRGKANGLVKLMDNFVIVADSDLATAAADDAIVENAAYPTYPDDSKANSDFKAYYTAVNEYNKKYSEGTVASFNKNMKLILVSKKDGTKIADLVQHSEKSDDEYVFSLPVWNAEDGYWMHNGEGESFSRIYYNEVIYLKFNDNTEVEMGAYFSEGFDTFEAKFEDFLKAFENN